MLIEQSPSILELDVPSIRYHSGTRLFENGHADIYELMQGSGTALGELCPRCSYPKDGQCTWCPEDPAASQEIPECHQCHGRTPDRDPWFRRSDIVVPALISAAVTVVATVASTILLQRLGK